MIGIRRPEEMPGELHEKGVAAAREHCDRYDAGTRVFNFDEGLYRDERVVEALLEMQHHKCFFCEQIIGKDGDVEHFRPKGGFRQAKGDPLEKPGYFWLAYSWNNLFRACIACNQRWKKNLFPLRNPESRCRSHFDDLNAEIPLLIDPTVIDPETLIGWRDVSPYPIDGDDRAHATIEIMGLREERLLEIAREKHLNDIRRYLRIVRRAEDNPDDVACQQDAADARDGLTEKLSDSAPFLAMTKAYLASKGFTI